ncbi:hypothetical protein GJ744_006593 [Endocarpon pusillum]|uniref:Uncharacterized protein n=1 Tax=Endocarpon pusillum TaxID=364733 RepID=A0A8H7AUW4_9EURO|nr:hypothetical protein GJ744_006593 [Endocarpon pusillum]
MIGYPELNSDVKLEACVDCIKYPKLDLSALAMSRQRSSRDTDNASVSSKPSSKTGVIPKGVFKSHQPSLNQSDGQSKKNLTSLDFDGGKTEPSVDEKASSSSPCHSLYPRDFSQKTYRGAYSINIDDLFALWDRTSPQASLNFGSNMMSENDELSDHLQFLKRGPFGEVFRGILHTVHLREKMYIFYTVPCSIVYTWQSNNSLEVECRWFAAEFQGQNPIRNRLADYFWNIIRSGSSAINLFNGNVDLAGRLIMFDLLSASVSSWIEFLLIVRRKSNRGTRLGNLDKIAPMIDDRDHLIDFSRATRDLSRAIEVTIKVIKLRSKFSKDQQLEFDILLLRQSAALEVLDDMIKDIDQNADQAISRYQILTNQRKEASLKRLTLVASIFLPLSLACSMLSMTQKVNKLGSIWWDWLGIVFIIGLVVLSFYRVTTYWHNLWQREKFRWASEVVKEQWKKAQSTVLEEDARNGTSIWIRLMPSARNLAYRTCKYLFFLATAGSFLVGMFVDVSKGAQTLGFSALGAIALFILTIVLIRFIGFWCSNFVAGRLMPEIDVKEKSSNKKGRKRKAGLISKAFRSVFILLGTIGGGLVFGILSFFFARETVLTCIQIVDEFLESFAVELVPHVSGIVDSNAEKRGRRESGDGDEEATDVATDGVEGSGERRKSQVGHNIDDVENQRLQSVMRRVQVKVLLADITKFLLS